MSHRFISPETPPEGIDRELLTILAEEGCEVGQRATKALRFGVTETQQGQPLNNAERIAGEIGDLLGVVDELISRGIISCREIEKARVRKAAKLRMWMQFEIPVAATSTARQHSQPPNPAGSVTPQAAIPTTPAPPKPKG